MDKHLVNNLTGIVYERFIKYAVEHSDAFMLVVKYVDMEPFHAEEFLQQLPPSFLPHANVDFWKRKEEESEAKRTVFEAECLPFLKRLHPFLIKTRKEIDPIWPCSQVITDSADEYEINLYRMTEESGQLLLSSNDYLAWRHPTLPEDLCLFRNQHCWACACSHEKLIWIYPQNEQEYNTLKELGVSFLSDYTAVSIDELFFEPYIGENVQNK